MKSIYARRLRKRFAERLKSELPFFEEVKAERLVPGHRLYRCHPCDTLWFFLYLQISQDDDSFTVEVGWSRNDHYPWRQLAVSPHDGGSAEGIRFRLPTLWIPNCKEDPWWEVAPSPSLSALHQFVFHGKELPPLPDDDALRRVDVQVNDVIRRILDYAMPYFRRIAAEQGCELELPSTTSEHQGNQPSKTPSDPPEKSIG